RNPESSPQVDARWRLHAMVGEITVPRVRNTAASDVCAASAMQDENDGHRWRRNPESSPQVEPRWQVIAMGGEMTVPRVPNTAASDICAASAMQDENDRHRWRRNPESSPQVEPRWQVIAMGGEMTGPRVPNTAASDDGAAAAVQEERGRGRRRRTQESPPGEQPRR